MSLSRFGVFALIGLGSLGLASAGCQNKKPVNTTPALSDAQYQTVRQNLLAVDAGALVGRIVSVDAGQSAAEVGDIAASQLKKGDVLLIVDADSNALATATVFQVNAGSVATFYEAQPGGRAPVVGDAAVRMTPKPVTPAAPAPAQ
jgi:hypothetical protein